MNSRRMLTACLLGIAVLALARWLAADVHRNRYIPQRVNLLTASAQELAEYLASGTFTSESLVREYLHRIHTDNTNGLQLRALLTLTPENIVLDTARQLDAERKGQSLRSKLHGVPIVVKDNMWTDSTLGMKTTFGAYAFRNATAPAHATIVAKALQAGMIVLGKSNLGEMNGFKEMAGNPGWSSVGGLTISAYDGQHPCGSSGGSAVAVSAGFTPISLGTETQGSISCPASFTSTYGLKVSTGLFSRFGILPSSTSYDSPGVFAHSAWDIGTMLDILSGADERDSATIDAPSKMQDSFSANIGSRWSQWRMCTPDRKWFWPGPDANAEERKMGEHVDKVVEQMRRGGARIIHNCSFPSAQYAFKEVADLMLTIIKHEMIPASANVFSQMSDTMANDLEQLVKYNQAHTAHAYSLESPGQSFLESAVQQKLSPKQYEQALSEARDFGVTRGIDSAFDEYDVDIMVLPAWTYMSIYAAWSGAPTATVPLGMYGHGKPYGLGFVARRHKDKSLVKIMHLFEQTLAPGIVPRKMQRKRISKITGV